VLLLLLLLALPKNFIIFATPTAEFSFIVSFFPRHFTVTLQFLFYLSPLSATLPRSYVLITQ